MPADEHFQMLIESLWLLASDYEVQCRAFPDFVHVPDEIALTFSDNCIFVNELVDTGHLSQQQRLQVNQVDEFLNRMSADQGLWTLEALKKSPHWSEVRLLAKLLLENLGVAVQSPNLYWIRFVGGSRPDDDL